MTDGEVPILHPATVRLLGRCRRIRERNLTKDGTTPRRNEGPFCAECSVWTYFIQCDADGPIKVGQARDVASRRTELQTASPYQLHVRAKTKHYSEAAVHEFFADEWLRGEWFRPSPCLLAFIETLQP